MACHPEHAAPFPAFQHGHHRREHADGAEHHAHAEHGHSHGVIHESIKRSRAGLRAVMVSLGVLALTAIAQAAIYVLTDSVALLADLIHNAGDALTAVPLGSRSSFEAGGSKDGLDTRWSSRSLCLDAWRSTRRSPV